MAEAILTYADFLAERERFIDTLTGFLDDNPPVCCECLAEFDLETTATVLFLGESYCAPHALMFSIGEQAAAVIRAHELGIPSS